MGTVQEGTGGVMVPVWDKSVHPGEVGGARWRGAQMSEWCIDILRHGERDEP